MPILSNFLLLFTVALVGASAHVSAASVSHPYEIFREIYQCSAVANPNVPPVFSPKTIRILYDVNPSEGFNLRRDVYLRLVVFLHNVQRSSGWSGAKLVLPPFRNLYHWQMARRRDVSHFWNHFFNLGSLCDYTEVLDLWQFFDEPTSIRGVAEVVRLRNFEDMFENGHFVEKYLLAKTPPGQARQTDIMGFANVSRSDILWDCRFQGSVNQLQQVIEELWAATGYPNHLTVFVRNAEVVLHDGFGDVEFWRARRSMRFADSLVTLAKQFRETVMNDDGKLDNVQRPDHWQDEQSYRNARGGDYICAHLRRGDFPQARPRTTPTLKSAAQQIKHELMSNGVNTVFLSSDCTGSEFNNLKRFLPNARLVRYKPGSVTEREQLGDGAIAIIDQIICSHARYFLGTFDSTFTYRIYEEREILGFTSESSFNTFCVRFGSADEECEQNSVWPIVYK